jgi:hypothetical protein
MPVPFLVVKVMVTVDPAQTGFGETFVTLIVCASLHSINPKSPRTVKTDLGDFRILACCVERRNLKVWQ